MERCTREPPPRRGEGNLTGRVLVVDDDESLCELFELVLARDGFEVVWRTSALAALELVAARDFDVVLTDLGLADLGGAELCERILGIRPDVPVIVVTGNASLDAAVAAIRAGAYDFISKPVDAKLLSLAVERAIQHGQLRVEGQAAPGARSSTRSGSAACSARARR